MTNLRKTKIISTLGPATQSPEVIHDLIAAGASIFRFNMSHASHDWVESVNGHVRAQAVKRQQGVATLVDLQGPSIRTGDVETPWELEEGQIVEFRNRNIEPKEDFSVTTNYDGLHEDVSEGNVMLVDNGEIHFEVISRSPGRIVCKTQTEGTMGSRRHINLPGVKVNLPALTDKDLEDLKVAAKIEADFVAISFVRDAAHIRTLREELTRLGSHAEIVAKIEDQEAVKNLKGIIKEANAVMVARGDLGIEVHIEKLPVIQRKILRKCNKIGRRVIVATHMLESMIENPVPTRAEITDVANAVFERADAVMLSGETSVGEYPVKCVEVLHRITSNIENAPEENFVENEFKGSDRKYKIAKAAVVLADSFKESKIIVFTAKGILSGFASKCRPAHSQIFAFTPTKEVARRMHLNRGVQPFVTEFADCPDENIHNAIDFLRKKGLVAEGDPIIVLSDVLKIDFDTDAILLRVA